MIDIDWKENYKIGEFACPSKDCNARNVRLSGSGKKGKRKDKKKKSKRYTNWQKRKDTDWSEKSFKRRKLSLTKSKIL